MEKPCTLTIYRTSTGYLLRIAGRGTMRESPTVRDFLCGAIDDGAQTMVDLSDCEYLDSTFLGCLIMLHKRGKRGTASFRVVADAAARRRLLETVRLEQILDFADSPPECKSDPVELPVTPLQRREFAEHLLETHRKLAELGGPAADTFVAIANRLKQELDGRPP